MSWLFSRALVEEFSGVTSSDGEPSVQLSVTDTQHKFWREDSPMDFSQLSQFGLTCSLLTEDRGEELLTWFRAVSHARTSALPAKGKVSLESVPGCGVTWRASLAKFDPASSSWKTVQLSLLEDSELSSVIWPRSGMTVDGQCWELPTLAQSTNETASGWWPTPCADDTSQAVRMWPMPTVSGNYNRKGASATSGDGLATAVRNWPTPTAGATSFGEWGGSHARSVMRTLVPEEELYGPLNPVWVEWLMGWPGGWTDLKPLETGKFHEWRQQHLPIFLRTSIEEQAA